MCVKLRSELDEFVPTERTACFVRGMIAPDTQRHAIARISQGKLAVRLLFTRQLWGRTFHLHMYARRHRAPACAGRRTANFCQSQQIHHLNLS